MADFKDGMSASNFALNWGKVLWKLYKCSQQLLESWQWEENEFLSGFSSSKEVKPLLKMLNSLGIHNWAKDMKMCIKKTMCEVANFLGISFGSVQSIVKVSLNMHHIAAKFVPWCRAQICSFCFVCTWISGPLLTKFTAVWENALNDGAVAVFTV
jgi:hypothetical protein